MSDTIFIVCFSCFGIGLFLALFMIGDLLEKIQRLKENLDLTRMRVAILERLHREEEEDEE